MKKSKNTMIKSLVLLFTIASGLMVSCNTGSKPTAESQEEIAPANEIGIQIYSVRDALNGDFAGTVKKVSDIGYKYVEAYGLGTDGMIFGMTPAKYKSIVDSLGMKVVSVHATYFTPEEADVIINAAKELGVQYVIVPWLNDDKRADYLAVADNFNKVGEMFKESGIKFGYHNHAFEFEPIADGQLPEEILIKNTNPELVVFELDLYWIRKAGLDPMEFINKFPGRFSMFHVKDADDSLNQTTVGTGIIDFQTILKAKDVSGWEYYFVEDEREDAPLANINAAFGYLNKVEY